MQLVGNKAAPPASAASSLLGRRRCPARTVLAPPATTTTGLAAVPPGREQAPPPPTPAADGGRTARVKAVAAKISAARELARRLSEEKNAAAAAAAARSPGGDGGAGEAALHDAERAAALAAAQAARADAAARATAGGGGSGSGGGGGGSGSGSSTPGREQVARLRAENDALKALLLELAADRRAAQDRLSQLQDRMTAALGTAADAAAAAATAPAAAAAQAAAAAAAAAPVAAAAAAAAAGPPPPGQQQQPSASRDGSVSAAGAPGPAAEDLLRLARAAAAAGAATFAWPAEGGGAGADPASPVPVGAADARVYYNRAAGPLPRPPPARAQSAGALVLKIGFNRWETIETAPMQPCAALAGLSAEGGGGGGGGGGHSPPPEWWEARLGPIAEDTFSAHFVVTEAASGTTDNNRARDFALPLAGGPTEQELADRRAAAYEAAEAARERMLAAEEEGLWARVVEQAAEAAERARDAFRTRRAREHQEQARLAAEERSRPPPPPAPAADPAAAPERREGVYAWFALGDNGRGVPAPGRGDGGGGGAPTLRAGARALFAYNARSGPLASAADAGAAALLLHLGHDGWQSGAQGTTAHEMSPMSAERVAELGLGGPGGQQQQKWFSCEVAALPGDAADGRVLDFVLSDRERRAWDNAGGKDHHTALRVPPPPAFRPPSAQQLMEQAMREITEASRPADAAAAERLAAAAAAKVEARARVMRRRREAQRQFLYTVPVQPRAGEPCDVFYNPDLTPLRGRPEIFLRAGFNRWRRAAAAGPLRMLPAMPGGVGFLRARIDAVPADAHVLDAVFADTDGVGGGDGDEGGGGAGSGFYDNNGGLDYHVPVVGADRALHPPPVLSVVHIAVEMAPIAKVGGMGDVVTALARAVQEEGHGVEVMIPKYDVIDYSQVAGLAQEGAFAFGGTSVRVWTGEVEGLRTTFLEPESGQFWRGCIYGRADDAARFAFFCGAALECLRQRGARPDVLHCHDWQSAPAVYGDKPPGASTVFTIHNLNYGADLIGRAMGACDAATTVSPTYAAEIAGHPAVAPHLGKMFGVRNGIDQDIWDPRSDPFLPRGYGREDLAEGKAAAKAALRARMGLASVDAPVVGVVTRLVHQKGIHLIKHAAWRTLERGGQFVLLGSAPDPKVQAEFDALRDALVRQYGRERAALAFSYDEPLSHLIYAGCDALLVPSIFEPCGLTQMIAMRYGEAFSGAAWVLRGRGYVFGGGGGAGRGASNAPNEKRKTRTFSLSTPSALSRNN